MNTTGLKIDELSVTIGGSSANTSVLHRVSFTVAPGEVVGLVGESGGGKTMVARAITGQLPTTAHSSGRITIDDEAIAGKFNHTHSAPEILKAALCFQNPLTALSPTRQIGKQIVDRIVTHSGVERAKAAEQALSILSQMGIRDPKRRMEVFPHELSGGMAQRVMIALAIACEPRILIADEPSTGLDVTLTRDIMKLFRDIADKGQQGVLIISHDIAAISATCNRLMVLYAGSLVESGPTDYVLKKPAHPYTAALIDSVPTLYHRDDYQGPLQGSMPQFSAPPVACPFEPRCSFAEDDCRSGSPPTRPVSDHWTVKCFHSESAYLDKYDQWDDTAVARNESTINTNKIDSRTKVKKLIELQDVDIAYRTNWGRSSKRILKKISVTFNDGESVGIVGESGCGKSTLARAIMGLIPPLSGQIRFDGIELAKQSPRQLRLLRRRMQLVFQDPLDALNPKLRVSQIIRDPLTLLEMTHDEKNTSIARTLGRVRLDEQFSERLPSQLSGGQAQRVGIARGLVIDPELIVFDEPTSALDVTVQAQILGLIKTLIADRNRTYIFISHDLATIKDLCDRVVVMYMGRIVEDGPIELVFNKPSHPYTRALLGAVPQLREETTAETVYLKRDLDEAATELIGCALAPRCPFVEDKCNMDQALREISEKHSVACWKV